MPALNSSVLILGLPENQTLPLQVGADIYEKWRESFLTLSERNYDVICASSEIMASVEFSSLAKALRSKNPSLQMVLLSDKDDRIENLKSLFNQFPIFRITEKENLKGLERDVVFSLEEAQMAKQELQLENLVKDQNEKLTQLYQDLEARIQKRQGFLLETRRKTYIANARWESLREAMIAIYQSTSLGDMEKNLLLVLQPTLQLDSIRILLNPQDSMLSQQKKSHQNYSIFKTDLFRSQDRVGSMMVFRSVALPFQREEMDFLIRVAEAVSLAMDRQTKLEQSETLKEQWQATFNAVADPVSLINQKYELIQANSAFLKKSGLHTGQIAGQKCHKLLFQRDNPCTNCELGKNFRLESQSIFNVYSQLVPVEPLQSSVYVNLYHDVTDQLRMESKILESARLAEIGTIGSSIAHELNNPLGGILSFVQLIKMDLKKEDPLYADIESMEEGVRRCKEIIENLLGFARNPESDVERDLDLRDVIERAVKIVELQTKSLGIDVKLSFSDKEFNFRGHMNLLSQAFRNLLQASIEALLEKLNNQKGFQGQIELRLVAKENQFELQILDNGLGADFSNSLSLSVAGQIIRNLGGQLEFSSQSRPFRVAKVTLPRPVFQA
jgi:two-component system, NtrC family, sensor kinase